VQLQAEVYLPQTTVEMFSWRFQFQKTSEHKEKYKSEWDAPAGEWQQGV